jgi:hypothetical protein
MKPLSTSVYTFEKLIQGGFLYVDKTAQIFELIKPTSAQYFLARPRRFGKSLLVSTLKAIFQGRQELFKGIIHLSLLLKKPLIRQFPLAKPKPKAKMVER